MNVPPIRMNSTCTIQVSNDSHNGNFRAIRTRSLPHLVNAVAQSPQLVNPGSSLDIGIVPGPNCSHGCRLISSVGLSRVLKVRVRPSWTIDTNIACCCNVWTAMRFAHDSNDSDAGGCSDWLCSQPAGSLTNSGRSVAAGHTDDCRIGRQHTWVEEQLCAPQAAPR